MIGRNVSNKERQLIKRAQRVLPGGSLGNIYGDVVVCEGHAGRIRDVSGNDYIDYLLGSGPMLVGHAHPEVLESVHRQIEKGTTFFATNESAIELAERIVEAVPCAEKVRFTSSGTEATQYAMRTARAFRNRDTILKFEGGFHGMNDYALMSMGPTQPLDFPRAVPDSAGIPASIAEQVLIAPFNNIETTTAIIERHHDALGGVILEPMQRLIPPKEGFLAALRQVTQRYEVPLIFDEVVTGFRFAYGGAQEYYGVVPDLCVLGKAMSGGFALAAVAGRQDMMANFEPAATQQGRFMPQIGTFSGNPVAATASLATLDILKYPGTYQRLFDSGRQLISCLKRLFQEASIPAQIVGEPPVFDVFFTETPITDYRSTLTSNRQMLRRMCELLLERGIFRGDSKFYIATVHTQEDLDFTMEAFASVVEKLKSER